MVVEQISNNLKNFNLNGRQIDIAFMEREELSRKHQSVRSSEGQKINISLREDQHLHAGDILYIDENKVVVIELKDEDIISVYPDTYFTWAKVAYNIGNMHSPLYIEEDCLMIPYDNILENVIKKCNVTYTRSKRKLSGEKANVTAGRSHGHE